MSISQQADKICYIACRGACFIAKCTDSKHIADSIGVRVQVLKEILHVLFRMSPYCQVLQERFFVCMGNHTISTVFNDVAIAH